MQEVVHIAAHRGERGEVGGENGVGQAEAAVDGQRAGHAINAAVNDRAVRALHIAIDDAAPGQEAVGGDEHAPAAAGERAVHFDQRPGVARHAVADDDVVREGVGRVQAQRARRHVRAEDHHAGAADDAVDVARAQPADAELDVAGELHTAVGRDDVGTVVVEQDGPVEREMVGHISARHRAERGVVDDVERAVGHEGFAGVGVAHGVDREGVAVVDLVQVAAANDGTGERQGAAAGVKIAAARAERDAARRVIKGHGGGVAQDAAVQGQLISNGTGRAIRAEPVLVVQDHGAAVDDHLAGERVLRPEDQRAVAGLRDVARAACLGDVVADVDGADRFDDAAVHQHVGHAVAAAAGKRVQSQGASDDRVGEQAAADAVDVKAGHNADGSGVVTNDSIHRRSRAQHDGSDVRGGNSSGVKVEADGRGRASRTEMGKVGVGGRAGVVRPVARREPCAARAAARPAAAAAPAVGGRARLARDQPRQCGADGGGFEQCGGQAKE